jgi:hypothetical protein
MNISGKMELFNSEITVTEDGYIRITDMIHQLFDSRTLTFKELAKRSNWNREFKAVLPDESTWAVSRRRVGTVVHPKLFPTFISLAYSEKRLNRPLTEEEKKFLDTMRNYEPKNIPRAEDMIIDEEVTENGEFEEVTTILSGTQGCASPIAPVDDGSDGRSAAATPESSTAAITTTISMEDDMEPLPFGQALAEVQKATEHLQETKNFLHRVSKMALAERDKALSERNQVRQELDELRTRKAEEEKQFESRKRNEITELDELRTRKAEEEKQFEARKRNIMNEIAGLDERLNSMLADVKKQQSEIASIHHDSNIEIAKLKNEIEQSRREVEENHKKIEEMTGQKRQLEEDKKKIEDSIGVEKRKYMMWIELLVGAQSMHEEIESKKQKTQ